MIIGIDASRANRPNKTGVEWYSYYLIRAMGKLDRENTYILYTDTPFSEDLMAWLSDHPNFSVKVLKWPWKFFWTQGRLSLEMLFHKPDVLFIPSHALPIIHPRKTVATIHDIGFHREGKLYDRRRIGADTRLGHRIIDALVRLVSCGRYGANSYDFLEWSTRFALKRATKILAISQFTKDELIDAYKAPAEKIAAIPHGYNSDIFHLIPDGEASQKALRRNGIVRPYIFYVGRLEKKKNTATLVQAFAKLKEKRGEDFRHKLYLIGWASFGFDEIQFTINELGLESDVFTPGWISEEDMPHIYARADAFVFPSNYEGFGIPLLQAMATRTPIASSTAAALVEVAGDAAVYFDPGNVDEMATALETAIFNDSRREELVTAGAERVKAFGWDKTAAATIELIKQAGQE